MSWTLGHTFTDLIVGTAGTILSDTWNLAAHKCISVGIRQDTTGTFVSSVTDTAGNTYFPTGKIYNFGSLEQWLCFDTIANASNQITVTYNTSTGNRGINVLEFASSVSGYLNPLDSVASPNNAVFFTAITSLSLNTRAVNTLLICLVDSVDPGTWTVGTGFTLGAVDASGKMMSEYRSYSSIQTGIFPGAGFSSGPINLKAMAVAITDDITGGGTPGHRFSASFG